VVTVLDCGRSGVGDFDSTAMDTFQWLMIRSLGGLKRFHCFRRSKHFTCEHVVVLKRAAWWCKKCIFLEENNIYRCRRSSKFLDATRTNSQHQHCCGSVSMIMHKKLDTNSTEWITIKAIMDTIIMLFFATVTCIQSCIDASIWWNLWKLISRIHGGPKQTYNLACTPHTNVSCIHRITGEQLPP